MQLTTDKVKVDNGTVNFVFTLFTDEKNKNTKFKAHWRCHICDVVVGGALGKHALGRKHQAQLLVPVHPSYLWTKTMPPLSSRSALDLKVAPGEPVPPGFESEVRVITEIQASLDTYNSGPLIGSYLLDIKIIVLNTIFSYCT